MAVVGPPTLAQTENGVPFVPAVYWYLTITTPDPPNPPWKLGEQLPEAPLPPVPELAAPEVLEPSPDPPTE